MNKFERVVRPFQTGDVFAARVLSPLQVAVEAAEDVVLEWGQPIQLIAKGIGISDLNSGGKHWSEVSRSTSVVRIENPDDPTQFVNVERIDSLHLKDETGGDHFMTLNNG